MLLPDTTADLNTILAGTNQAFNGKFKDSVVASLNGVVAGVGVTAVHIKQMKEAAGSSHNGAKELQVTYTVTVKETFEAAAKDSIKTKLSEKLIASLKTITITVTEITTVTNGVVVCPEPPNLNFGTLDCKNKMVPGTTMCTLLCAEKYHLKNGSNRTCGSTGAWEGIVGVCEKACDKADDGCRTRDGTEIGKCDIDDGKCLVDNTLCTGGSTAKCGAAPLSSKGTCTSTKCIYSPSTDLKLIANMELAPGTTDKATIVAGTNTNFNNNFKQMVADIIGVDPTAVHIKQMKAGRRLDGKFLQDAQSRMLQVEYSVQVKPSAAADAKAALDSYMFSSNLS